MGLEQWPRRSYVGWNGVVDWYTRPASTGIPFCVSSRRTVGVARPF